MAGEHRTQRPASPAIGAASPRTCRVAMPRGRAHAVLVGCRARAAAPETGQQVLGCQHAAPSRVDAAPGGFGKSVSAVSADCPHPRRGAAPRAPWGLTGLDGLHCLCPLGTCRRRIRPSVPTLKDSSSLGSPRPSERPSRVRVWKAGQAGAGRRWAAGGPVCLGGVRRPLHPGAISRPCHRPCHWLRAASPLQRPGSGLSPAAPPPEQLGGWCPFQSAVQLTLQSGRLPASRGVGWP